MGRRTKAVPPPLQQVDYDALPCSVRRKYFSSFERLQIQQQAPGTGDQTSGPSSASSSLAASSTPFSRLHSRRRAQTATARSQQEPEFTKAEAAFFLSLPDKVRKQHFSAEEQVILFAKCDQALLPPSRDQEADEVAKQRFHDFHFDFSTDDLDNASKLREPPRGRRSSISTYSPYRPSFNLSPKSKKEREAESSIFFIDIMDSPSTRPAVFRRTLSLGGPPICHPTCASAGSASPLFIFPAEYRPRHQRSQSSALSGRRSLYTPPTPTFDPEAKYYQDPETRTKLRMYLASPQKFDEAIEFGFPSSAEQENALPHYQLPPVTQHSRKFSRDMHTFFRDGTLSSFEDPNSGNQGLESDGDSTVDFESPRTPSSAGLSFGLYTRQMSSVDSSGLPTSHPSPGHPNREMTLRMTLTRPDLRADEDALYGWQHQSQHQHQKSTVTATVQDDPFALEELVLTDDQTGTKGPFYVKPKPKGSLVTRLLKRASLKGRYPTT
ncbi:uncharacterized protein M421DRAFT_416786 [Didymella exigua CBS 183.55]|uniref:Uncharacterized protein n=1 Tax=Didymella exigua CBS 183.55 TaxID=1150837 RepID=A0A6A5RXI7_9PLEO|nr:uncharacterized protein M421DRAFT_416786 [Didymella exigua CBS 183.55]KAF1932060.1 hypothetical protein M421DRAFT_416786 [Didymella exigua CBS 183.55]